MKNTMWDILVSLGSSIHDVTSEQHLSFYALIVSSLFFWIVGSSHLKILTTEEHASTKFCFATQIP
jgi:hypothetical protein